MNKVIDRSRYSILQIKLTFHPIIKQSKGVLKLLLCTQCTLCKTCQIIDQVILKNGCDSAIEKNI